MSTLPCPARYFPFRKGRYEVAPGLLGLGADFGNGPADQLLFQLDSDFSSFRDAKLRSRSECLEKYHGTAEYSPAVSGAVAELIVDRLCEEHPDKFRLHESECGARTLHCVLTGERLEFDRGMNLTGCGDPSTGGVPYASTLDALACQVQDDLAVVSTEGERNWVSAVHVCSPSGWVPIEKLGLDYRALHAPVPGMAALNPVAGKLVDAMVRRGPYVRFVWGISPSRRLNRHPEPPHDVSREEWRGTYDWSASSPFVVRVERQCLWPLPDVGASLFLIRLSFIDAEDLGEEHRAQLRAALLTMSSESREYKGISGCFEDLTAWLAGQREC